ncbi:MAG: LysR family transcriptional regulator [Alphaproteobacteria bacterium HGW-Alphaproteobacteria-2]|nr:MAG: LysR family transcriptional regulator [Alphaproteobacteria bacterium HGW-Alphaproteobacteria-2]
MKTSLQPGLESRRRIHVDKGRTIGFMGEEGRVYATPELLRDIEQTCRDLLLAHCDAGEDSVGTFVKLRHMAATPLGLDVELAVRVAAVEGREVRFEITGQDALDRICEASHSRFVVDGAKTLERLKAKRAAAAGRG